MIQFRIISVSKRESSEVNTVRYTYKEGEETQSAKTLGGVWEEIEFAIVYEEKPLIQIANVAGDGYLVGSPGKLLINNSDLFGKYKVGDIIEFVPTKTKIVTNGPSEREVFSESKSERLIDPQLVATALGAKSY